MISFGIPAALGAAVVSLGFAVRAAWHHDVRAVRVHLIWCWGLIALAWAFIIAGSFA